MFNKKYLLFILIFAFATPQANAFWGLVASKTISAISKSEKILPEKGIIRLSKLSDEIGGTAKVGRELGKLNLPKEVLEDSYLRIAIHQKKLTRNEAEKMFSRLSGTSGFRQTLRKVIGNNNVGTIGHLNELRIADNASINGFKVLGIGEKFSDGLKKSLTDIDILLKRNGKVFAIEAKDYASTTKLQLDKFRADLDTLVSYKNKNSKHVIPIFTITNKPTDPRYLTLMQHDADKRGVQLIFGNPQEQIEQIKMLEKIL